MFLVRPNKVPHRTVPPKDVYFSSTKGGTRQREIRRLFGCGYAGLWTNRLALVSGLGHLGRLDQAHDELQALIGVCPEFTLSFVRERFPLVDTGYMEHLLDGLRKSGVKE